MIPRTVMSGFRATGVYPFNRRAISIPGVEESTGTPTAKLAYQQGIKYLPFHSPHHIKLSQVLQPSEELRSSGQPQSQPTFKNMNFLNKKIVSLKKDMKKVMTFQTLDTMHGCTREKLL